MKTLTITDAKKNLGRWLMAAARGMPKRGEAVEVAGYRLEASDLRGRRIARVRIAAPPGPPPQR